VAGIVVLLCLNFLRKSRVVNLIREFLFNENTTPDGFYEPIKIILADLVVEGGFIS